MAISSSYSSALLFSWISFENINGIPSKSCFFHFAITLGCTPYSVAISFSVLNSFTNSSANFPLNIDSWLEQDKTQHKKQRHTAVRIYHRLKQEHGYCGGESTVRHYVRIAKTQLGIGESQAVIPLDPLIGIEAEIDWGTVLAVIDGQTMTLKFFCMRSKYSGKHFVRCYPCERQQAFFDAHMRGFEFFGGIFQVLI